MRKISLTALCFAAACGGGGGGTAPAQPQGTLLETHGDYLGDYRCTFGWSGQSYAVGMRVEVDPDDDEAFRIRLGMAEWYPLAPFEYTEGRLVPDGLGMSMGNGLLSMWYRFPSQSTPDSIEGTYVATGGVMTGADGPIVGRLQSLPSGFFQDP